MIGQDVVVYADRDGRHYLALFGESDYWRWPAEAHGWARRERSSAAALETCQELDAGLGALALRLSGVHDG